MSEDALTAPPNVASPRWSPAGRGGFFLRGGPRTFSPWDVDSPDAAAVRTAMMHLLVRLAEHPAMRPHLSRVGGKIAPRRKDGRLVINVPREWRKKHKDEFVVALYLDPLLRPLFDELDLAVEQ